MDFLKAACQRTAKASSPSLPDNPLKAKRKSEQVEESARPQFSVGGYSAANFRTVVRLRMEEVGRPTDFIAEDAHTLDSLVLVRHSQ